MPDWRSRGLSAGADDSPQKSRLLRSRTQAALAVAGVSAAMLLLGLAVLTSGGGKGDSVVAGAQPRTDRPDFVVTLTSGEPFQLSAYDGRVIVLEFLAPGCPSCAAELAMLSNVAEEFEDRGVVVLVLDVGGLPRDSVAEYYQGLGGGNALLYAPDKDLRTAQQYGVRFLGTTVVLNGDGREVYRDGAGSREADLVAAIEDGS